MRKILFNDKYGLNDAVLNGTKTMTRRFIPIDETIGGLMPVSFWNGKWCGAHGKPLRKQPYKVGEVLAIAQSYKELGLKYIPHIDEPDFKTNTKHAPQWGCPWHMKGWDNKMYVRADVMPHQIEITDVKIERIQDISNEDCMREGIKDYIIGYGFDGWVNKDGALKHTPDPRSAFGYLIMQLSGKKAWEDNPWVFAYSFKLIK